MKKIFTPLLLIYVTFSLYAQAPQKLSYQFVVRNASGALVVNHAAGIRISVLQGSASGTVVYQETFNVITNANGLATIELGNGTPVSGTFSSINWASGTYYLRTETDPAGGTSYSISGTSQLISVPYALHAKSAASYNETDPVFGAAPAKNITSGNITNWNTAYGWGNHAGLYRPVSWVPAWSDVTGKPAFATVATSGSYNDLINKPAIINSQWTTQGSNIYYGSGNVGIGLNNPTGMMEIYGNSVDNYPTLLLSEADGYSRVSFRTMSASAKHWVLAGHTNVTDGDSQFHLNYNNGTTGKNIFSVYGNSKITFDGKVGIGTTAPGSLLQVHSNITYVNNVTPIIKISDNFKTWNIGLGDPGDRFSISSEDNIDRLTILKSNGFVGLGTTAPSAKLEVAGQVKITGGSPGSGKVLTSDATGLASWQTPQPVTWLKNGSDIYYNAGRVAIGMTFPRYELTIYQANDPHIGLYNSTSGTSGTDGFTISTGSTGSPVWIWNWENSNMHFGTNNANRMIINADGHISMMRSLDLNTESTFGALYVKGKQALWSDDTYFSWGYDATYNYFARPVTIGDPANHTSYMLYVKGNAYTTGSWGSSDASFKKNISPIDNSLNRIMKIRGARFEFRTDEFKDYQFAKGPQYGFIAQELEKEFPEVVKTETDGYKSVNYNGMIPVLLEAIKEQQKQIGDQQKQINELKEQLILIKTNR
jgi:hypothetical protein